MPTLKCKPSSVGVLPMLGRGECFSHKNPVTLCQLYYVPPLCWISLPVGTIIINPCDIIFNLLSGLISDWHKFIWGGRGFTTSINNLKAASGTDLREVAFLKGITYFDLRMLRRVMLRIWCSERILTMFWTITGRSIQNCRKGKTIFESKRQFCKTLIRSLRCRYSNLILSNR